MPARRPPALAALRSPAIEAKAAAKRVLAVRRKAACRRVAVAHGEVHRLAGEYAAAALAREEAIAEAHELGATWAAIQEACGGLSERSTIRLFERWRARRVERADAQ